MISVKLEQDGLYHYEYEIDGEETLSLVVAENINATCIVDCKGSNFVIHKQITLYPNSSLHILYRNECDRYISNEIIKVYENAEVEAGYLELHDNKAEVNAVYELLASEAKAEVLTTTFAENKKVFNICCEHKHPHTFSNMKNYAINDEHGELKMIVSGKIEKGAKGSKSHQLTRVLTLADKEHISVTPLLLIDENDVEASHSCAIGEMNEDHLYYLQTRGINRRAALGLLTLSYLLPILKIVENEQEIKEEIEIQIQRKVGL